MPATFPGADIVLMYGFTEAFRSTGLPPEQFAVPDDRAVGVVDPESGGKTFDAGAGGQAGREVPRDGGGRVTLRIFDCKKPLIAAINGPAVGVGITMTLPMDRTKALCGGGLGPVGERLRRVFSTAKYMSVDSAMVAVNRADASTIPTGTMV